MNGEYQIFKRNRETGIRDTLIERFTGFSITLNWGEVSKFSIDGKTAGTVELEPGDGIVFYRNGELFFSGIIDQVEINCEDAGTGLKSWSADGCEDSIVFSRYIAFADPLEITFAADIVDKVSGYAWNRLLYYIRRNMGADALSYRKIGGLTLPAAQNKGAESESAYRYQALDQALKEIAGEDEDLLCPAFVWDPDTGAKSIEIRQQRDMTESIIIAPEFGNITTWTRTRALPKCNAVWVCSGTYPTGEETEARIWIYQEDTVSTAKYGRFEKVVTKSDIKVAADDPETDEDETVTEEEVRTLLADEAKRTLKEEAAQEKFSGTMVETPEMQFMTDWRCGDLVSCIIDGERFTTTIRTVEVSYSNAFEEVKPTLGDNERGEFSEILKRLKGLDTRMSKEELS